jgi:hypothetical protein
MTFTGPVIAAFICIGIVAVPVFWMVVRELRLDRKHDCCDVDEVYQDCCRDD